jgi:cell division protein FtsQ
MKKTGAKRVSGYDSGLGSGVLTAPEESYASAGALGEGEARGTRKGPAPAGALQRGFGRAYDEPGAGGYAQDEPEYVPQRGKLLRFRSLPRSVGGRIVLGVIALAVIAAGAVAFAEARTFLMHDARFVLATSDDIQMTGAEHLTREQIVRVFGSDLERNIFRVSLAERQADLERLPWVAHATVMRLLPNVLRVQITERTPVAFVRQGSQIGLVDASGVLLDMPSDAAGDPHYSFPVLTGLSVDEAAAERGTKMEVYEQFMRELDGGGQRRTESVSEVDVADPEDVKALITSGGSDIQVHFGQEKFLDRYEEFEQHLAEWKQQYPTLASADMRYDGQIVLEMQGDGNAGGGGTATVATASAESAKPVVVKAPKAAAAKTVVVKAAVVNVAAAKPPMSQPAAVSAGAPKAAIQKPDLSNANMPKPAAPQPVVLNAAPKPPAAKKFLAKPVAAKAKPGSGTSAANRKVFARLAAEHRAELAKEHRAGLAKAHQARLAKGHKAAPVNVAKNGRAAKGGIAP